MKPIELSFKGINSYVDEVKIDFSKLRKAGVFGIFGDTGAGKTTILDAITIALYGKTDRVKKSLTDAMNPNAGLISVRFKFEIDGETYEVIREYRRDKHGGLNSRIQALYKLSGGQIIPLSDKTNEINSIISEKIIGLNFDDFTRVVILPQGKFSQFLDAKPGEKAEILERIFGTDIYGKPLQEAFKARKQFIQAEIDAANSRLEALKDVNQERIEKLENELKSLQNSIKSTKETYRKLDERLKNLKKVADLIAQRDKIEAKLTELKKKEPEILELKGKLEIAEKLQPLQSVVEILREAEETLKIAEKERDNLLIKLNHAKEEFENAETRWKEFDKIYPEEQKRLLGLQNVAKQANQILKDIEDKSLELKETIEQIRKLESKVKELEKLENELKSLAGEIQKTQLSDQEKQLLELHGKIIELKGSKKNLDINLKRLEERAGKERERVFSEVRKALKNAGIEKFTSLDEAKNLVGEKLRATEQQFNQAEERLKELENRHRAIILAKGLVEGEPCPVCGSIHHPIPAFGEIAEEEIKNARNEVEKLRKSLQKLLTLKEKINSFVGNFENSQAEIEKERMDYLNQLKKIHLEIESIARQFECENIPCLESKIQNIKKKQNSYDQLLSREREIREKAQESGKIREEIAGLREKHKNLTDQIKELRKRKNELIGDADPRHLLNDTETKLKALDDKKKKLSVELENKRRIHEDLKQKLATLDEKIRGAQKNRNNASEKLKQESQKLGLTIERAMELIMTQQEIDALRKSIKGYENEVTRHNAQHEQILSEIQKLPLKELPEGEPEKTQKEFDEVSQRLDELNRMMGERRERLEETKKNLKEKSEIEATLKEKKKKFQILETLHNLISGKKLSKFVVMFYLKEIINEANRILDELTGGKIKLVGVKGEDIDFQVYDSYTGHKRTTKSLSGGEKFLVSFSLAVAFSLYIQKRSTKSIDFFFIDEGFGTLDDELQDAMSRVFEDIRESGKLVGLITHVRKFREIVPAQILVTRDPTTLSSKIEVRV